MPISGQGKRARYNSFGDVHLERFDQRYHTGTQYHHAVCLRHLWSRQCFAPQAFVGGLQLSAAGLPSVEEKIGFDLCWDLAVIEASQLLPALGEVATGQVYRKTLSLIHISEPTRRTPISYAVFCL